MKKHTMKRRRLLSVSLTLGLLLIAVCCMTLTAAAEETTHTHTLVHHEAVEATDCAHPGSIEHWACSGCGEYYSDAEGMYPLNPWFISITVDCVRPEGVADCADWICELCGEENSGLGEHDTGGALCQDGTCSKCGDDITGYGCANYTTPACVDGVCYYCGGAVAGFGHENGAWAPCQVGECSYGCGLTYPATADHVDEDADDYCDTCWNHLAHDVDPCVGGECSICWTYIAPAHEYLYPCDPVCMNCYEITNPDATHDIVAVDAVQATCQQTGNIAYWYCSYCGATWADEALTQVTNRMNVITFADHVYPDGSNYCEVCQVKITGASLTLGSDLTVTYTATVDETLIGAGQTLAMVFEMDDKYAVVSTTGKNADGRFMFPFEGITPQCMGDNIKATLVLLDADGEVVDTLAVKEEYSVKAYVQYQLTQNASDAKLVQLLTDLLTYGAASQQYAEYKTDRLVTEGIMGMGTPSTALPTESENIQALTPELSSGTRFRSAGIQFDNVNRLYVRFLAETDVKLVVKRNGNVIATETYAAADENQSFYTEDIKATQFDDAFTFELYAVDGEGETLVQTLTYSVNTYVYRNMNKTEADGETLTANTRLAMALYRYGASAVAYTNA